MNLWTAPFELSSEQAALREQVRRLLEKEVAPHAGALDAAGPLSKETSLKYLKLLVPMGYLSGRIPEVLGGAGLPHVTVGLLYEELRRVYASLGGVVGVSASATVSIARHGAPKVRERLLPGLMAGELIACSAITEPDAGSDPSSMRCRAERRGDKYVLNGTKIWISNGTIADVAVVTAVTDPKAGKKGVTRFVVERKDSPFTAREIPKLGLKSFPTAEISFEDCEVPAENRLGEEGEGLSMVQESLEFARLNAAVGAVGIGQAAFEESARYARERTQWGKPIGRHQLVAQMIAEQATLVDASRLLAYRGLALLDRGKRCPREASMAKRFATESCFRVASLAVQVMGAYGLSEEWPVARYFRDARCYTIPDGTTQIHDLIIARDILGMSALK